MYRSIRTPFYLIGLMWVALALTASPRQALAHDADGESEADIERAALRCGKLLSQLGASTDANQMILCMDFYWHHGGYKSPEGSFNNTIAMGLRILEVEPDQIEMYTDVAWLMWSKCAKWVHHPDDMPDGAKKADEAIALLERGARVPALQFNSVYYLKAADIIAPLARYYRPDFYAFVIRNYVTAYSYAEDDRMRVRARLNLGHLYNRRLNDFERAKTNYRIVLQIDPSNKVAQRELNSLEHDTNNNPVLIPTYKLKRLNFEVHTGAGL